MYKVKYKDEIDFKKKLKSLKKYCPMAYKDLIFNIDMDNLFKNENGYYKKNLKTTKDFKFIYGQIQLLFSINENCLIIEDIKPGKFFIDGHMKDLENYKGIPYRNNLDKFKIDLLTTMKKLNE